MWKTEIKNSEINDGIMIITVEYRNDDNILTRIYKPTADNANEVWLKDQINQQIEELDKFIKSDIKIGLITPIKYTPSEIPKQTYINNLCRLKNINLLNSLKITAIETEGLLKWLQNNFNEEYLIENLL